MSHRFHSMLSTSTNPQSTNSPSRILLVDCGMELHSRFSKAINDSALVSNSSPTFLIDECDRNTACDEIALAAQQKSPFAIVLVEITKDSKDQRLENLERLLKFDPDLQIIACASAELKWATISNRTPRADNLTILLAPIDPVEAKQATLALCRKRNATLQNRVVLLERSAQLLEAQESLRLTNRHLELVSRMARVGYGSLDLATQIIELSDNACNILDAKESRQFSICDLIAILPISDRIKFRFLLKEAIYREIDFEFKSSLHHRDGELHHIMFQINCERDGNSGKTSLFLVVRDITKEETDLQTVQHASLHDTLTGLPNRANFNEQLDSALKQSHRNKQGTGLILLDFDRFKEVNDSFGHPVGDGLLKEFAKRITECVHEPDTVARLGGDEFAIVQTSVTSPADTLALLDRIYSIFNKPFIINEQSLYSTVSAGVALSPGNGEDIDVILKNADLALYRAKQDGRGVFRFFDDEMDQKLRERLQIEADLRHAIDRNEFAVFYQPIISTDDQQISAMEALVRWTHPTRGIIPPSQFIEIAEATAAIVPIGKWILRRSCLDAMQWPEQTKVAVNVSAVQLQHGGFCETVREILCETGLAASRLEIEITETAFLRDNDESLRTLNAIRDQGVSIAMDNFGIGYCSLSYLRSFPFDKIKLDKSFVDDFYEPESMAIISAVAGMGESLGMLTCAEGIETEEQLKVIREQGYAHAQGYFIGKPISQSATFQLFKSQSTSDQTNVLEEQPKFHSIFGCVNHVPIDLN